MIVYEKFIGIFDNNIISYPKSSILKFDRKISEIDQYNFHRRFRRSNSYFHIEYLKIFEESRILI